jgi:Transposase DDE domain
MACGKRSRRCCRLRRPGPRVAAGGCPTATWSPASLCAADRSALAVRPRRRAGLWQRRGDLLAVAGRVAADRGCGSGCTSGCWSAATGRVGWTGRRPAWTAPVSGPSVGGTDRRQSTDRGKPGSRFHLIVDGAGLPLAALVSAANTHDSRLLVALVDQVGPVRGRAGRPRQRPERLYADKAYDFGRCRQALRARGISARIARRKVQSARRLGRHPGRSRGPSPGCRSSAASRSATSGWPRPWRGCCSWPAR